MNRRRTITMLRCGCLPLEVETGTTKTPLQQRICQLCENSVEDETHFLNHCKPLTLLRVQLYEPQTPSMLISIHSPLTRRLSLSYSYVHVQSPLLQVNLSICLSYANVCWNANHIIVLVLMLVSIQSPACPPSLLLLLLYLL